MFCAAACLTFAALPPGFSDTAYATGLSQPDAFAFAPDGRIFVCEKTGAVKVVTNGKVVSTFMTLNVSSDVERGVLGIAFDPDFNSNHFLYIYYTTDAQSLNAPATPKNRVSRFTADGNAVVPGSETILLDNIPSDAGNHNAGCLRFAPDGTLFIATGDGGLNHGNSQDLTNLAGKILRINKDGSIPADNPFDSVSGDRHEIWCYGLRNPFRFAFRPGTGVPYIADVGENTWEEVNIGQAGGNYGWNLYEGPTDVAGFISPEFYYMHTSTESAAIVGGCFMVGQRFAPPYNGSYFYGDYVRDVIRRVVFDSNNKYVSDADFTSANTPVDFCEGPSDGDLYYVSINQGSIRRIAYKTNLNGLTLNPNGVVGGANSTGTVTLDEPAPAAGALILLSSTSGATVPTSVRVSGGATSANFTVTTTPGAIGDATITATRLGITEMATLNFNATNNASFASQTVPTSMTAGHQYAVTVTMMNTGSTTWTNAAGYRLMAYNPSGNMRWGFDRVFMPSNASVAPGSSFTFSFTVTAPAASGPSNFQWRMLLNGLGTFGQPSTNVVVTVN